MPSLRTLLNSLEPSSVGNPNTVFYVQNTSNSALNGGRCCLWTVPAGYTKATFEMWGAGGDGQGARCCERAGTMPTNGSYSLVTIDVVAGQQYRICAAGSGCSSCCCGIGARAFPSYVVCETGGAVVGCAVGGCGGCSQMTRGSHCSGYICCWGLLSDVGTGDITMDGTGNISLSNDYCRDGVYMVVPGGLGSDRMTSDFCASSPSGSGVTFMQSCPSFPAGAGTPARTCGGSYCYGQHGAGGLVKISYS